MIQTIKAHGMPRRRKGPYRKKKRLRQDNPHVRAAGFSKKVEQKRQVRRRICPTHGVRLVAAHDANRLQWVCPKPGCGIRCNAGSTSTPYDSETGQLRAHLHIAFDALWKPGPGQRYAYRGSAYEWLCKALGMTRDECHIGMFDADTCRRALAAVEKLGG